MNLSLLTKASEVLNFKLILGGCSESDLGRKIMALRVSLSNRHLSAIRIRLREEVLTDYTRYVALVPRDIL